MWIPKSAKELPYYKIIQPLLVIFFGLFVLGVFYLIAGILLASWVYAVGGVLFAVHYPLVVFLLWREARDGRHYGELHKTSERE